MRRRLALAWMAAVVFTLIGCGEGDKNTDGLSGGAGDSGWAIAVDAFEGVNHQSYAEQRRMEMTSQTKMTGWWVKEEGEVSLVMFGRYRGPQDRLAQTDLEKLHQLKAAGRITPRTLMLTPIQSGAAGGEVGQYDLRAASVRGVYTLQMAVYDEEFGSDFRQAAEQAARALRQDGDEVFYYHGPNRSMVTVGVFGEDAARYNEKRLIVYSAEVENLRRKFPSNLVNGRTMRVRQAGGKAYDQPSHLVRIPGQE